MPLSDRITDLAATAVISELLLLNQQPRAETASFKQAASLFAFGITDPGFAQISPNRCQPLYRPLSTNRCQPLFRPLSLSSKPRWATICTRFQRNQDHQRVKRSGEGWTLERVTLSRFRTTSKPGEGEKGDAD